MSFRLWSCVCMALPLAALGCANLEAKKVPLADRLTGKDDRVHGFRYYLSRPYVVVSERVCVGQNLAVGPLLVHPDGRVYLQTLNADGSSLYYDQQGYEAACPPGCKPLMLALEPPPSGGKPPASAGSPGTSVGGGAPTPAGDPSSAPAIVPEVPPGQAAAAPSVGDPQTARDAPAPSFGITNLTKEQLLALLASKNCPSPNAFQFVMLPDFEEQMAVKDRNFAAYGKYEMHFADGWQLNSVSGSWDATQVAVKALQVLGHAVSAAAEVRKEELDKLPTESSAGDPSSFARDTIPKQIWGVRIESLYIEPGIYRVQRTAERSEEAPFVGEHGLLAQLGFGTVADVQVLAIKAK